MGIKGFGISGQSRKNLRKPISGGYRGFRWAIECHQEGLFQWRVGTVDGWTAPESSVEDALRDIKQTADLLLELEDNLRQRNTISRESIQECVGQIARTMRWARFAARGNLKIDMKRRKNGTIYYIVEETTTS